MNSVILLVEDNPSDEKLTRLAFKTCGIANEIVVVRDGAAALDLLFATGKYELQPTAREALAKFSGIVIAHPGLKMQVEGYTDITGSDTFNQTLSENRANSVRAYLIAQGIDPTSVTAVGYGKSNPVASNDTATGRQQNRRVEIIISGEIIGTQIGSATPAQP